MQTIYNKEWQQLKTHEIMSGRPANDNQDAAEDKLIEGRREEQELV